MLERRFSASIAWLQGTRRKNILIFTEHCEVLNQNNYPTVVYIHVFFIRKKKKSCDLYNKMNLPLIFHGLFK